MEIWAILGIEATHDAASIRKAYAVLLKKTRPETDPEGFTRLRAAYEAALAFARSGVQPVPVPLVRTHSQARVRTIPVQGSSDTDTTNAAVPQEADRPPIDAAPVISRALDAGDVKGAADLLLAARAAGTLALGGDMRLSDQLSALLTHRQALALTDIIAAATTMGWYGPDASASPALRGLQARIEAERWLDGLRRAAGSWPRFVGANRPAAARLMLGRGRVWGSWILPPNPPLRELYGAYLLHARWIGPAFDAARIETVRKLVSGSYTRRAPGLFAILVFGSLIGNIIQAGSGARENNLGGVLWLLAILLYLALWISNKFGKPVSLSRLVLLSVRPLLLCFAVVAVIASITALLKS